MRVLLLVALLTGVFLPTASAEIYSCRDRSGELHFSDNLQGLPDGCRSKEQKIKPGNIDNLNFVPSQPEAPPPAVDFQRSVRAVDRDRQEVAQQSRQLPLRAKKLLEDYRAAKQQKRQARRSWSYRSREVIKQADEEIVRARAGKKQLLQELEKSELSTEDKKTVQSLLDGIVAE